MHGQDVRHRVLVVDDEPRILTSLQDLLEDNYEVLTSISGEQALDLLKEDGIAVLLTDQRMPGMSGDRFLARAREVSRAVRVLMTGYTDLGALVRAVNYGQIYAYIAKPWDPMELRVTVRRAAEHYGLIKENERLIGELRRMNSELAAANRALRGSEERFRSIVETTNEWIWEMDAQGTLTYSNPTAEKILGYRAGEMVGKKGLDFVHPEDRPRLEEILSRMAQEKTGRAGLVTRWLDRNGVCRHLESNGVPVFDAGGELVGFRGADRDITERKRLEEQFRHAQKMEAVGRLAGGVAHDFNNLLTGIIGYSQLLLHKMAPDSPAGRDLLEIRKLGERAAVLTRQLLALSRRQSLKPEVLHMNTLIANASNMLQRLIRDNIDLRFIPANDLGNIEADPGQLELVLVNLVVNSRDAMPAGGTVTIQTQNVVLDPHYCGTRADVEPGRYVMLAVTDNGCGMDEATKERIFEPFFTTKEVGKGTGLGLSTVYGMIKQHGGHISVYSEVGKGTSFKIYFPRVDAEVTPSPPPEEERRVQGSETILLVEDAEAVREVAKRFLEGFGYTVLSAANGDEALKVVVERGEHVHLLLADVLMPGMSGKELYERLLAREPSLKVLYMSGFTDEAIVHQGLLEAGTAFIAKPFAPLALGRKVRDVLDGL